MCSFCLKPSSMLRLCPLQRTRPPLRAYQVRPSLSGLTRKWTSTAAGAQVSNLQLLAHSLYSIAPEEPQFKFKSKPPHRPLAFVSR